MRVLRMEDSSLREITREFLNTLDGRRLAAGSVVLLGSLYQLSFDGTAQYAEDWHWCRRTLMDEVGEVLVLPVLPLLPMPLEGMEDSETVRSLLEFLMWFDVFYDCPYIVNTVRLITDELFPVNNDANVRRKMYMSGSVAQARAADSFFYKLTSILLNFNM
jgi:hypothetical protein